eukprot:TRINITY_DN41883_c0_g1_i1.p1 TRINITY_DN41883_c0_g1~~TRINITY_DN41883_c0_g1_i1.p1  ORF type:complete len:934 (-),score=188.05 TRINITY_DN41883_c0_g1_i1:246-2690(-)
MKKRWQDKISADTGSLARSGPPIQEFKEEKKSADAGLQERAQQMITNLMQLVDSTGWVFVKEVDGVKIYSKDTGSERAALVKGEGEVDATPTEVLALMNTQRKEWDAMLNEWRIVEEVDCVTQIRYELYYGVWPTAPREICSLNTYRIVDDELAVSVGCSIAHAKCPETKGNVRAELKVGGSVIRRLPNNRSHISLVMDLDIGGNVPAAVLKMISSNGPLTIAQLRNFLPEARQNNLIKEQVFKDNWKKYCDSLIRLVTPTEHKEEEKKEEALALEKAPSVPRAPIKIEDGIIFETGETEHEPFLLVANENLARQWKLSNSSTWKQERGSSSISLYVSGSDNLTTMAIMDIDGAPLNILTLLVDSTRRRDWDSCFDSFRDIETISSVTSIEQWFFKFPWPVSWREFIVVTSYRFLENGTILWAYQGIDYPDCPPDRNYARTPGASGAFVIIPKDSGKCRVKFLLTRPTKGFLEALNVRKIFIDNQCSCLETLKKVLGESYLNTGRVVRDWFTFLSKHPGSLTLDAGQEEGTDAIDNPEERLRALTENSSEVNVLKPSNHIDCTLDIAYLSAATFALNSFFQEIIISQRQKSDWKVMWEKNQVRVDQLTRSEVKGKPRNMIHVGVKVSARLSASPDDIARVITSLGRRMWIDLHLCKGEELMRVNSTTRVSWLLYDKVVWKNGSPNGSSPISESDVLGEVKEFVVVEHRRDFADGSIAVVSRSVPHRSKPKYQSIDRIQLIFSGWRLVPRLDQGKPASSAEVKEQKEASSSSSPNFCDVVYMNVIEVDSLCVNRALERLEAQQTRMISELNTLFS